MQTNVIKSGLSYQSINQPVAADYVVELLAGCNVEKIFGIPGGAVEPLFNAVTRYNRSHACSVDPDSIDLIIARHETGGAFMADGYARESASLGVCCATSGPGSTNLITGVASAFHDKTPMLVLTPQPPMASFGKEPFQDGSEDGISIVSMLASCTKYSSMVCHVDQLKYKFMKAIRLALSYPQGPVHLSIPSDIWSSCIDPLHFAEITDLRPDLDTGYDHERFKTLCQLISKPQRLLFLLGSSSLPWADTIIQCAELLNAEVVTTPSAKGCLPANHPLNRGVVGFAGHHCAHRLLNDDNITHILSVGVDPGGLEAVGLSESPKLLEKTLYIDSVVNDYQVSQSSKLQLCGNMQKIFFDLSDYLVRRRFIIESQIIGGRSPDPMLCDEDLAIEYRDECLFPAEQFYADGAVKPQYLMSLLPKKLPMKSRFYIDAGNGWAWATHYLHLEAEQNYRVGMRYGSMGWAIGAAIGAAIAKPDLPIVCVTGDGSYLMSGQELTVAVELRLPVIFIILNDSALGMVKHGQRMAGAEQVGFELPRVNFAMMAQAVGATGITLSTAAEFDALDIQALFDGVDGPLLLDVHIDGEEVPPIHERIKELGSDSNPKNAG